MSPLARRTIPTPAGHLRLLATDAALVGAYFSAQPLPAGADGPETAGPHAILDAAARELAEYVEGGRTRFTLPLAPEGTEFQRAVWSALLSIPCGETRTYGWVAAQVGRPDAVRAVGTATGRNPICIVIPCHRVIGADGSLTGYAGGLDAKRWLLAHEKGPATPGAGEALPSTSARPEGVRHPLTAHTDWRIPPGSRPFSSTPLEMPVAARTPRNQAVTDQRVSDTFWSASRDLPPPRQRRTPSTGV